MQESESRVIIRLGFQFLRDPILALGKTPTVVLVLLRTAQDCLQLYRNVPRYPMAKR